MSSTKNHDAINRENRVPIGSVPSDRSRKAFSKFEKKNGTSKLKSSNPKFLTTFPNLFEISKTSVKAWVNANIPIFQEKGWDKLFDSERVIFDQDIHGKAVKLSDFEGEPGRNSWKMVQKRSGTQKMEAALNDGRFRHQFSNEKMEMIGRAENEAIQNIKKLSKAEPSQKKDKMLRNAREELMKF